MKIPVIYIVHYDVEHQFHDIYSNSISSFSVSWGRNVHSSTMSRNDNIKTARLFSDSSMSWSWEMSATRSYTYFYGHENMHLGGYSLPLL